MHKRYHSSHPGVYIHTVEVCGADKGDVDTQIPMVG